MNFYRQLAYELRRSGLESGQVRSALSEVRAYCEQSGEDPRFAFGTPAIYAASFEKGDRLSLGTRCFYSSIVVGLTQVGVQIGWAKGNGLDLDSGFAGWMWTIALGVFTAGFSIGQIVDRRLPRPCQG